MDDKAISFFNELNRKKNVPKKKELVIQQIEQLKINSSRNGPMKALYEKVEPSSGEKE